VKLWTFVSARKLLVGRWFKVGKMERDNLINSANSSELSPEKTRVLINLFNKGSFKAVILQADELISSFSQSAVLFNIRAAAYAKLLKHDAAIKDYRNALKIKPDYAEAHNNLGNTFLLMNDLEAALDSYQQAVTHKSDFAEAYNNIGNALKKKGILDAAVASYQRCLEINPKFVDAYFNIGNVIKYLSFSEPNRKLSEIIIKILGEKTFVRPTDLATSAISLLKLEPAYQAIWDKFLAGELAHDLKQVADDFSKLPLLLKLMPLSPLPDLEIEWLLTNLRSSILHDINSVEGSGALLKLQCALALHCYTNDYIYVQPDEDTNALESLEKNVVSHLEHGLQPSPSELACLASYKALNEYSWHHLVSFPNDLKELKKRHISDDQIEAVLRSKLPVLSGINDNISTKVTKQYEEHPYPKWVNLSLPLRTSSVSEIAEALNLRIRDKNIYKLGCLQILIAGCGTGQHAISTAARFKDCKVLAIDLSLRSLTYAKRKTEELGLGNIEYMKADILDLGKLDREFDIIESSGVLHHMENPLAGWKRITKSLKQGGLMKVGLYSELGRTNIVKMHKEIEQQNIGATASGMKSFRSQVVDSAQAHHKAILSSPDFYSLSALRDLLFHVQEHRFTLPKIENYLDEFGLDFCGFELDSITRHIEIKNGNVNDVYDLERWNSFEEKNPETFSGMYQFWCQKVN
jgi:SAM-dependent methyltransferase/tetratricopeptide (TPR) repeat protein